MALPKIVAPEFVTQIPSTQTKIKFRPFLVKEEKVLFMALEGGDQVAISNAMQQVLEACIIEPEDFSARDLASFDIEFLFLQLRSKSVGESIEVQVHHEGYDKEDSDVCKFASQVLIPVDDIKVVQDDDHDPKIMLTDSLGMILGYPSITQMEAGLGMDFDNPNMDNIIDMLGTLVLQVFDADEVYDQFSSEEIREFFDNLSSTQFEKCMHFFNTMPSLKYRLKWKCQSCDKEDERWIEGVNAFFTSA
jgi:hypothetical protein